MGASFFSNCLHSKALSACDCFSDWDLSKYVHQRVINYCYKSVIVNLNFRRKFERESGTLILFDGKVFENSPTNN
jgi:hypothetical protein